MLFSGFHKFGSGLLVFELLVKENLTPDDRDIKKWAQLFGMPYTVHVRPHMDARTSISKGMEPIAVRLCTSVTEFKVALKTHLITDYYFDTLWSQSTIHTFILVNLLF